LNGDVVRQMYEALGRGDIETFVGVLDPNVAWTVPGRHHLAGTFTGVPALLTHLAEVAQRTEGKIAVSVVEVVSGDGHTVAVVDVALSVDCRTVKDRQVHLFALRDGRITSVREYHGDEAAMHDLVEGPA
jgi:ketosteroid isomerase-like protein